MPTQNPRPSDFDPLIPEEFDSAHVEYARLREQCPVAWSNAWNGFWSLMDYEDVNRAASDIANFTTTVQNVVPKVAFTGRRAPLHYDPPEHTPYRRALNSLLSRAHVERLRPRAEAIATELLEPMIAAGKGDICADFSAQLPLRVFGEWMRLPDEWLKRTSELGNEFNVAVKNADEEMMKTSSFNLYDLARAVVADRVENPQDPAVDPTSALLATEFEGKPLPQEGVVGCVRQVLIVGLFAPLVTIGSITVHLSRDRELQQYLRDNPSRIPAAVEEFLRLYTPYRGFARTARTDIELGGRLILKDEPIALNFSSANRDEKTFPNGGTFQMDRPNIDQHIAFGRGPHSCPGSHLGRMEIQVALAKMLELTSDIEVVGEPEATRMPEMGVLSAEVALTPR